MAKDGKMRQENVLGKIQPLTLHPLYYGVAFVFLRAFCSVDVMTTQASGLVQVGRGVLTDLRACWLMT